MTISNSNKFTIESISELEHKIQNDDISLKDLETIQSYLELFGARDYLINEFKQKGIYSFQEFVYEKSKKPDNRNRHVDGYLMGILSGIIEVLKRKVR